MTKLLHFMDNVGIKWYKRPFLHRNRDENRPWHLALELRQRDMAFILVDAMPPEEAFDSNRSGSTMELAIKAGYKDIVEHMFLRAPWKSLSDWNKKMLMSSSIAHTAITTRDIGMLQIVLDHMPALMESSNYYKAKGRRPLSYAIHEGYYEEMCYMLDKFPDFIIKEPIPIIHTAVMGGHINIVNELISRFPESMNHFNEKGQRPLSLAACQGDINMVRYFLNNFPSYTTVCNEDGTYPIHEAVASGHVEVVKEFLSRCPETLYQVDGKGRSILHIVVECIQPDVLSYLKGEAELKHIFHLKDENGNTFADLAKQKMIEPTISTELPPKYEKRGVKAFLKKKMEHLMVCTRPKASI